VYKCVFIIFFTRMVGIVLIVVVLSVGFGFLRSTRVKVQR